MNVRNITLNNYGLFRGEHTLDLRTKRGRPIVLFGGKNGAGKTTLLEALQLCLYGSLAIGDRVSRESYYAYLGDRIHRSPALLIQPAFASVSVTFEHADVGRMYTYTVSRSWERSAQGRLAERFEVQRDGQQLSEVTPEQWQDFIRELIPPGVTRLFFFDGEKIQQLAETSSDEHELGTSIKALLGTDLVEKLQTDLSLYRTRLSKEGRKTAATADFDALATAVTESEARIASLDQERTLAERKLAELRASAARIEQQISSEGGAFAKVRDGLVAKREQARAQITVLEQQVRQLCQGVLPFALIPDLCYELQDALLADQERNALQAGRAMTEKFKAQLLRRLKASAQYNGAKRAAEQFGQLVEETFARVVPKTIPSTRTRQELSGAEANQILQWITQATTTVPEQLQAACQSLEEETRTLEKAEASLKRVPADDVLTPLLHELQELNKASGEAAGKSAATAEALREEQSRLADLRRKLSSEAEKLNRQAGEGRRIRLISKVQSGLDEFRDQLLARKIRALETSVTECFNTLARKTDAIKNISIDPKTFGVTLYDRDGNAVPKAALSAGEKQIYAISMLWALGRTSGRPLPVVIDTPLGRLDSDHRKALVERYLPAASHQVIVLSTDTEVDQVYFAALRPFIASSYLLEYDMEQRNTRVEHGYFFEGERETHKAASH